MFKTDRVCRNVYNLVASLIGLFVNNRKNDVFMKSSPKASPIRFVLRTTREVCTPAPIKWAEYSAINLPMDNKDSPVFMNMIFLNRAQKYKKNRYLCRD